jgi:hypothetical protein
MIELPSLCPLCGKLLMGSSLTTKNIRMCPEQHYDFYHALIREVVTETFGESDFYIFLCYSINGNFQYGSFIRNNSIIKKYTSKPSIEEIKKILKLAIFT